MMETFISLSTGRILSNAYQLCLLKCGEKFLNLLALSWFCEKYRASRSGACTKKRTIQNHYLNTMLQITVSPRHFIFVKSEVLVVQKFCKSHKSLKIIKRILVSKILCNLAYILYSTLPVKARK